MPARDSGEFRDSSRSIAAERSAGAGKRFPASSVFIPFVRKTFADPVDTVIVPESPPAPDGPRNFAWK